MININEIRITVIGLGYVGLPLAVEFGKIKEVIGFDINHKRIKELKSGKDVTLETTEDELKEAKFLSFTSSVNDIRSSNCYIITVPTPITALNQPELGPLILASKTVGSVLKRGDIVVFESTVYPGATEDDCVPILESESGLKFNVDFHCGYSPERINPGDKNHRIATIKKITSGSTPEAADLVDALYRQIVSAGTHKAESIKVAEAAKVIENTQRDLNIALVNELAIIFNHLEIDTQSVLEAAASKWNFMSFKPGLVGGHCIGVDPYYLTFKSEALGYSPEIILAGRRLNNSMGEYAVTQTEKALKNREIPLENAKVLIMGLTFKENCPDIRNTRVIDIVNGFEKRKCRPDIYDPWCDPEEAKKEYQISIISFPELNSYDAILIAVAHNKFKKLGAKRIREFGKSNCLVYDLKHILAKDESDIRL